MGMIVQDLLQRAIEKAMYSRFSDWPLEDLAVYNAILSGSPAPTPPAPPVEAPSDAPKKAKRK